MRVSVIRPGYLVSLKTTVRGGVTYQRADLPADAPAYGTVAVSRWETTRAIADPAEHTRAIETRGRCRTMITRVCAPSSFGLLCPQSREPELTEAIRAAQSLADAFNVGATHTRIEVFALAGRVADNDLQAARAIGAEVRELVDSMRDGIAAADPESIREAANKARALAGMLSADASAAVSDAIKAARAAAREIVRRVEKQGETAASVVQSLQLQALDRGRFAVLDVDVSSETEEPAADAEPMAGRALDLFGLGNDSADDSADPAAGGQLCGAMLSAGPAREFDAMGF